jgi:hypothetical protein
MTNLLPFLNASKGSPWRSSPFYVLASGPNAPRRRARLEE